MSEEKIKEPRSWRKYLKKAESYLEEDSELDGLLEKTRAKAAREKDRIADAMDEISTAQRIVKKSVKGEYKVSKTMIVSFVAALLYFIIPTDVIPDFILGWGFIDDISVMAFVFKRFRTEVEDFSRLEEGQTGQPGEAGEDA